jgi:hypothetical protein
MRHETHLLTLNLDSKNAVNRIIDRLTADGMQVIRSFDLKTARAAHVDCKCPHHGKDECDCQLVVLLVYDEQGTLLILVAHGKDNKTHFALADPPERVQEEILKNKILDALVVEGFASI